MAPKKLRPPGGLASQVQPCWGAARPEEKSSGSHTVVTERSGGRKSHGKLSYIVVLYPIR